MNLTLGLETSFWCVTNNRHFFVSIHSYTSLKIVDTQGRYEITACYYEALPKFWSGVLLRPCFLRILTRIMIFLESLSGVLILRFWLRQKGKFTLGKESNKNAKAKIYKLVRKSMGKFTI